MPLNLISSIAWVDPKKPASTIRKDVRCFQGTEKAFPLLAKMRRENPNLIFFIIEEIQHINIEMSGGYHKKVLQSIELGYEWGFIYRHPLTKKKNVSLFYTENDLNQAWMNFDCPDFMMGRIKGREREFFI